MGSEAPDSPDEGDADPSGERDRSVEVPVDLYKRVTVFSTVFATLFVVLGFMLFDAATFDGSLVRQLVVGILAALGVAVAESVLVVVFAALGFACVGVGAAIYIIGARFHAPGMGKPKDESDQGSDDG